jgi:hypothetical protein
MIGMNDVHWILENKKFHAKNVFWKIELKKLTNSEPGAKFSVFQKTVSSSQGSAVTIGSCLHNNLL